MLINNKIMTSYTRAVPKFGFAEDFGQSRTEGFGSVRPMAIFGRSSAEASVLFGCNLLWKYVSFSTKKRRRRLVPWIVNTKYLPLLYWDIHYLRLYGIQYSLFNVHQFPGAFILGFSFTVSVIRLLTKWRARFNSKGEINVWCFIEN